MTTCCEKISRLKSIEDIPVEGQLKRCLTTLDLTLMGVGGMVGSGVYILLGVAAKEQAGPGILLSFLIAAGVIFLAALCHTEFAARIPRTGGSYLYMYVSMGELAAFLMGWGTLMGIINGGATNGRAWSAYLDFLFQGEIHNFTETKIAFWGVHPPISEFPDLIGGGIILFITLIVAAGAHCSSKFNMMFAFLSIGILIFTTIMGFVYGHLENWKNFLPFGMEGVIKGAGACFWSFTGFEVISVSAEEAKTPSRSIPIAMALSLTIVLVLYMGTGAAVTLLSLYSEIDMEAPLPSAFENRGIVWARYIVSVGPLIGMTTTLLMSIYGFVRIAYAMSDDGLIFTFMSHVNKRTKVPILATLLCGLLMALQAIFFELKEIISFGILIALSQYVLISASVIILRYRPSKESKDVIQMSPIHSHIPRPNRPTGQNQPNSQIHAPMQPVDQQSQPSAHPNGNVEPNKTKKNKKKMKRKPTPKTRNKPEEQSLLAGSDEEDNVDNDVTSRRDSSSSEEELFSAVPNNSAGGESNNIDGAGKMRSQPKPNAGPSRLSHPQSSRTMNGEPVYSENTILNLKKDELKIGSLKPGFLGLGAVLKFEPGVWVFWATIGVCICLTALAIIFVKAMEYITEWWLIVIVFTLVCTTVLLQISIAGHVQNPQKLPLTVPMVPFVPSLSVFCSLILMIASGTLIAWVGFSVVMLLGLIMYLSYGLRHSKMNSKKSTSSDGFTRDYDIEDNTRADDMQGLLSAEVSEDEL